jgi:hypothetical protein
MDFWVRVCISATMCSALIFYLLSSSSLILLTRQRSIGRFCIPLQGGGRGEFIYQKVGDFPFR